jgi:hypothetical protein
MSANRELTADIPGTVNVELSAGIQFTVNRELIADIPDKFSPRAATIME